LHLFFSEDPDLNATQWDEGPQAQALDAHSTIQGRPRNNEVGPLCSCSAEGVQGIMIYCITEYYDVLLITIHDMQLMAAMRYVDRLEKEM
jgi:hypothetical protein